MGLVIAGKVFSQVHTRATPPTLRKQRGFCIGGAESVGVLFPAKEFCPLSTASSLLKRISPVFQREILGMMGMVQAPWPRCLRPPVKIRGRRQ